MASFAGKPEASLSPSAAALHEKALRTLQDLPPFSPILNQLLASLAGEDVSFAKLSDLIEKDAILAGNILHLVNSALYARRGTVNSVRHAVSLLGVQKLRNAALGMSLTHVWTQARPAASWSMARFSLHSAATATLSDLLAQRLPVAYPEGAFVAGLMHDIGRLLIATGLPAEHGQIASRYARGQEGVCACEREILGFEHPELSAQALAHWNLPEPIQEAVREHHSTGEERYTAVVPLHRIVAAADRYVHSAGVSFLPVPASANTKALQQLGLDAASMSALLDEFQLEFDAMAPFFR